MTGAAKITARDGTKSLELIQDDRSAGAEIRLLPGSDGSRDKEEENISAAPAPAAVPSVQPPPVLLAPAPIDKKFLQPWKASGQSRVEVKPRPLSKRPIGKTMARAI